MIKLNDPHTSTTLIHSCYFFLSESVGVLVASGLRIPTGQRYSCGVGHKCFHHLRLFHWLWICNCHHCLLNEVTWSLARECHVCIDTPLRLVYFLAFFFFLVFLLHPLGFLHFPWLQLLQREVAARVKTASPVHGLGPIADVIVR